MIFDVLSEPTDDYRQPPTSHVAAQEPEEELYQDTATTQQVYEDELYQDTSVVGGNAESSGVCARALYDYQACEYSHI